MRTIVAALFCFLPVALHAQVEIEKPWARATAPGAKMAAGYMVIRNKGAAADRLVGATTSSAARVETHVTEKDGDIFRMREVQGYAVPAGGAFELKPGGAHLMFVDIPRPFKAGETVPLMLRFEKAGEVKVEMPVLRSSPQGGDQQHHQHRRH